MNIVFIGITDSFSHLQLRAKYDTEVPLYLY